MKRTPTHRLAHQILPAPIRKALGWAWGTVYQHCVRPVMGLIFDLCGGQFRVDGCIIEVPRDLTTRAYRSCFLIGDYEYEERELIRRHLRPDDQVIELGACLGVVSCVTNRLLADKRKHLVVEGNPRLIPAIERNREINDAGFTVLNRAVSEQKEVTFYLHPEFIVGGTPQRKSPHPVTVQGATLAELDEQYGPFNVLIIDIEGSEVEAIPPASALLRGYRLVIMETHDWACGKEATENCRRTLTEAGLRHADTVDATEAWIRDKSEISE